MGRAAARTSAASAARFAVFFEESDADVEDATAAAIAVAAPATAMAKLGVVLRRLAPTCLALRPSCLGQPISFVRKWRRLRRWLADTLPKSWHNVRRVRWLRRYQGKLRFRGSL